MTTKQENLQNKYQSLETFPLVEWWKLLNKELELKEVSQEKLNDLYDEYFERMNNSKAKFMLRESMALDREFYKMNLIVEYIKNYNLLLKIPEIKIQEELKAQFLDSLKQLFPLVKLSVFSTLEEISQTLILLYNGQNDIIQEKQKENNENEKTNIYKIVANISVSLNLKLNPTELSVAEFIEYYKIAEENGK
jgi:hypothetical protein